MRVTYFSFHTLPVVLIALSGFADAIGQDDSFRCEGRLITPGIPAEDLVEHCGRPDNVDVVEVPILAKRLNGSTYRTGIQTIEHWIYGRGTNRFPARVEMEEGVIKRIEIQY